MSEAIPETLYTPGSQNQQEDLTLVPITPLLEEQRQRWQKGDKVLVEVFLAENAALGTDPEGMLRLIRSEIELRQKHGETPRADEYLKRFPQFADQLGLHFTKLDSGTDVAVDDTLEAEARTPTPSIIPPPTELTVQRTISNYEVRGVLGRGGMGVVYKAWQKALNRMVALKMILASEHAGADHLERFRKEAEAAAQLQHPNIAQIHEVGEADGHPFMALEYVEGGTLADKLDGTPQPYRQAAQLVETLARAMQHAHERGIVHRDLKPANVLLMAAKDSDATANGYGVPKITDFGLAKRLDVDTNQTQSGAILGTPSYMAPEQATGNVRAIGPGTDVYALGAILYDLLTGRPPFKSATLLDTLEQVKSVEPVPPARLEPKVPRDLETICLKCLRKEPDKRYTSAKALADDLRHFLNGEPIAARPTPAWERAWKWSRRRPAAAALLVVSVLAGLGLLIGSWGYSATMHAAAEREARLRRQAEDNFRHALDAVDEMLTEVGAVDLADVPQMEEVRAKLLHRAQDLFQKFPPDQSTDPTFRRVVARAHGRLGDIQALLENRDEALAAYDQAISLGEELLVESPDDAAVRRELGRDYNNLGVLLKNAVRLREAKETLDKSLALRVELVKEFSQEADQQDYAASRYNLGAVLARMPGKQVDAEQAYKETLAIQEKLAKQFPDVTEYRRAWARTLNNLGKLLGPTKRREEAAGYVQRAVDIQRELVKHSPNVPAYRRELATSYSNLGIVLWKGGKFDQSDAALREGLELLKQLSLDFALVPVYRYEWAFLYRTRGGIQLRRKLNREAEASFNSGLKLLLELCDKYPNSGTYRQGLSSLYLSLAEVKKPSEAAAAFQKCLNLRRQLVTDFPDVSVYHSDLGNALNNQAFVLKGEAQQAQGLEVIIQAAGPNPCAMLATLLRQAAYKQAEAWLSEAIGQHRAAIDAETENTDYRGFLRDSYYNLCDLEVRLGNHQRVAVVAEEFPKLFPDDYAEYRLGAEFLTRCEMLATRDSRLSKAERQQVADQYGRAAVKLLRQAMQKGFKKPDYLKQPFYDSLRQRDDFKELQQELEKEATVGVG
jgi:tetratricopeptide (TPR) repeat protein